MATPETLPTLAEIDALIVMGGSMGVNDEAVYPWLRAEKAFLGAAIAHGMPILGICLGAQLLAQALGLALPPVLPKKLGGILFTSPTANRKPPAGVG